MGSPKTLIYPFSIESPYFESYAWAVELAHRTNARLLLFTTLPAGGTQPVYHSLLAAHGYYLEHYPAASHRESPLVREPVISQGSLDDELVAHLRSNPEDIVILDASFTARLAGNFQHIVKECAGAIVLQPENAKGAHTPIDQFYDQLRRARLYKLPSNFFSNLALDRRAFNYLRKFFQTKTT